MATLLQSPNVRTGGGFTTTNLAFPSAVTAGSLLVCKIFCEDAAATGTSSASDSRNGSYNQDVTNGGTANFVTSINSFPNAAAGATTVTINSSLATHIDAVIEEWSGVFTTSPFDVGSNNHGSSTSPSSGATGAIAQPSSLVLGWVGATNFPTITEGSGYTPII